MKSNLGRFDRSLRFLAGHILLFLGLLVFNGSQGNMVGISISAFSFVPFYMAFTGCCFIFKWLKIHTLSRDEFNIIGNPYTKK